MAKKLKKVLAESKMCLQFVLFEGFFIFAILRFDFDFFQLLKYRFFHDFDSEKLFQNRRFLDFNQNRPSTNVCSPIINIRTLLIIQASNMIFLKTSQKSTKNLSFLASAN